MERRRYGSRENKAIRPTYSESGYFNPNPSRNRSQAPSRSNARNAGADRNIEISRRQNNGSEGEGELDTCDAPAIIGTCPFMCPEAERAQRERLRDLAVFERLDGNSRKSSPSLAVKKFCRTISTKNVQASDVRPLPVLEDTLKYLLELLDSSDYPFEVIHDFVFDRTRSIRQDLSMQNIIDDRAIWMYEKMVQFHVISHHKLQRCVGDTPSISSICHLNMEQLTKCLASLYNLYDANRSATCIYENEAEFRSLYVLRHLDSHHQSMGESLALWFRHLPSPIIKSKELSFARNALRSFRMGNYWRFFHAVAAEATYLQFYVMEHYVNEVRAQAVAYINHGGYKLHPYPIAVLSDILKMKEADLEFFCNASGLETSVDELGNKVLPTKQTGLCHPKGGCQNFDFLGLERMNYPVLFKCLTSERIKESTPCSDITDYAVT